MDLNGVRESATCPLQFRTVCAAAGNVVTSEGLSRGSAVDDKIYCLLGWSVFWAIRGVKRLVNPRLSEFLLQMWSENR